MKKILFQQIIQTSPRINTNEQKRHTKKVTFIDIDNPTPAKEQNRLQPSPYANRTSNQLEGRGHTGRGDMGGRGGQEGRKSRDISVSNLKDPVQLPHPWRNEVDNLIRKMHIDMMKEIKLVIITVISSQISKIARAMVSEIKTVISMEMSTTTNENSKPG